MIKLEKYRDKWMAEKVDEVIGFYTREFYPLDNFSSFKLKYEGHVYQTVEEAYQALKFIETDKEVYNQIINSYSAVEAKNIADLNKDKVRKDWDNIKVDIMEKLLRCKLEQNPTVREKLLKTKDYILVEDSPVDSFWGWGINRDGKNIMGKLWMKLRDEIRNC